MDPFQQTLIQEVKRRLFDEALPRLKQCLSQLSEEEIWHRPNANSNSMGNLVLHLCGNVRQWVISGLGHTTDTRQRQAEFDENGPVPLNEMLQELDLLMSEVAAVLDKVEATDLVNKHRVQGYEESGISILVHVIEHFSYHVGQMTYYVKAIKDMDMGYYAGKDLNET